MNEMSNGDVADLIKRSEKSAFVLGQVTGKIHTLIEKASTESVRQDLIHLFDELTMQVGEIYYPDERA